MYESTIVKVFSEIPDPRNEPQRRHLLSDILTIAILAIICGADDWVDIALFGRSKEKWLRTFLELPHGIPSHDTFGRVFARLDTESFSKCFSIWTQSLVGSLPGVIAIDGKTLRRSFDKAARKAAIHMVSAWSCENRLVLAQLKTEAKSNEIKAIPKLLNLLDIEKNIVTTDAMGCQKDIARQITDRNADYLFCLKGNHGSIHDSVRFLFDWEKRDCFRGIECDRFESVEKGHGRIETRRMFCTGNLSAIEEASSWEGLRSIAMLESTRLVDGLETSERRYFLSSLAPDAKKLAYAARAHWGIENGLHWVLDVAFDEDRRRNSKGNSAENFAILRHIALNLLKREKTTKTGIKGKRLKAGWDENYLLQLLTEP